MANLEALSGQVLRNASGVAYTGAKAYYWADVGLTTPLATYSNGSLATPNTNPVVSDGTTGAFGLIFLAAKRYWRTVTTSAGVSLPEYNIGPIDGIPGLVESLTAPSPTYPFLTWWDTTSGHLKRRKSDDSGWLDLGPVDALGNAATVTQALAGTAVDAFMTPDSTAAIWQRGTNITPSAGTLSLPSTGGGVFTVNAGNFATISAAQGGRVIILEFAGASVLTHGASLDLIGNVNRTTAAGGRGAYVNEAASDVSGTSWRELFYWPDDGSFAGVVASKALMEAAADLTFPVTAGRVQNNPGVAKLFGYVTVSAGTPTLAISHNVASITDTGEGQLTVIIATDMSSSAYAVVATTELETSGEPSTTQQIVCAIVQNSMIAGSFTLVAFDTVDGYDDPNAWAFVAFGDQ